MKRTDNEVRNPLPVIQCNEKMIDIPISELNFHLHLAKMEMGNSENMRQAAAHIRELLGEGILVFTSRLWMNRFNTPYRNFNDIVQSLRKKDMITVYYENELKYRFTAKYLMEPMKDRETRECPYPTMDANSFWMRLALLRKSWSETVRQVPGIVKSFLDEGKLEFTAHEWLSKTGMSAKELAVCMESLDAQHLTVNMSIYDNSVSIHLPPHRFTLRRDSSALVERDAAEYSNHDFWKRIYSMCISPSTVKHRAVEFIQSLLENGRIDFTMAEMESLTGYTKRENNSVLALLKKHNLIYIKCTDSSKKANGRPCARYRLTAPRNTLTMTNVNGITKRLHSEVFVPENITLSADEFWSRVDQMSSNKAPAVRLTAEIIRSMIANGLSVFTRQSWMAYSGMGHGAYAICRSVLHNNGLVYNLTAETRYDKKATGIYAYTLEGLDYSAFAQLSTNDEITAAHARMKMQCENDPEQFRPLLEKIAHFATFDSFTDKVVSLMKRCSSSFSECQWAEANGYIASSEAAYECSVLLQMGLLRRCDRGRFRTYSFQFLTTSDLEQLIKQNEIHAPRGDGEFWNQLATLEWSNSNLMRKAIAEILEMISEGKHTFSEDEWHKRTGMTNQQLRNLLRTLTNKGIIIELGEKGHKRFWIAYSDK
jgi:transcription initiation factor IIE alpha subunit/predicted transcriptional regulator